MVGFSTIAWLNLIYMKGSFLGIRITEVLAIDPNWGGYGSRDFGNGIGLQVGENSIFLPRVASKSLLQIWSSLGQSGGEVS